MTPENASEGTKLVCPLCKSRVEDDDWCGVSILVCTNGACTAWWYAPMTACTSCATGEHVVTCSLGECDKHCGLFHRSNLKGHMTIAAFGTWLGDRTPEAMRGGISKAPAAIPSLVPTHVRKPEPKDLIEIFDYVLTATDRR